MIDPNSIQIQNNNLSNEIKVTRVAEFDCTEMYDLNDDKDYEHFIKDIESTVRSSYEYKEFIKYLRENMGMDRCAFLKDVSNRDTNKIKIEIHHYPFSLRDIVEIVYRKRSYYKESLSIFMIAKEVMELHYKLMVGLIPLSETVHELAHSERLFIPVDKVLGRYNLFVDYYKPFIDPEMLDTLYMIEKATEEHSDIGDTTILEQNHVKYNISDKSFILPDTKHITDSMFKTIENIKNNNYLLPTVDDMKLIEEHQQDIANSTKAKCPIIFI